MSDGHYIIAVSADHAGFELKQALVNYLENRQMTVLDLGTHSDVSVDYPDYGAAMGAAIESGQAVRGIAICGSGIGISIAANRFKGVRAALCRDEEDVKLARQHNDANVLALGARRTDMDTALHLVELFLETDFEGGRHQNRVDKLESCCK